MMLRTKKVIGILLVLILILSACQSSTPDTDNQSDSSDAGTTTESSSEENESSASEIVTLRAVLNVPAEVNLENNPVLKRAEELTGIRLDIEAPPSNEYWDRTRIIVASGDYPDMMIQGTDVDMEKWAEEGILAELDDKIVNYPNLMANITAGQWSDGRALSTGKIVAVPRANAHDKRGYVINQTWLDNLGLEAPETIEEFVEVSRAFTFDDPDGNGKDDTYGVTFSSTTGRNPLFSQTTDFVSTAYNMSVHWGMPDADGAFRTRATSLKFYDYLDLFKDMYEEGILDRELIINKSYENDVIGAMMKNRVGIVQGSAKSYISEFITANGRDLDEFTFHAPLKLDENSDPIYTMPPSNWAAMHIFADSDKIDDCLRFLDFCNSEEGYILFTYGIEGIHYNSYDIETRTIDRTPEQIEALKSVVGGWFVFTNSYRGVPGIVGGETPEEVAKWKEETEEAAAVTTEISFPFVKQLYTLESDLPDLTRTLDTLMIRYISGEVKKDELITFVDEEYAPAVAPYEVIYEDFMSENPVEIKKP